MGKPTRTLAQIAAASGFEYVPGEPGEYRFRRGTLRIWFDRRGWGHCRVAVGEFEIEWFPQRKPDDPATTVRPGSVKREEFAEVALAYFTAERSVGLLRDHLRAQADGRRKQFEEATRRCAAFAAREA